jgi:2-methylcitrate dehydratase PrpD
VPTSKADYGAAPLGLSLTRELAAFVSGLGYADLPAAVVHQAKRGLIDWHGCALVGSRHPTIQKLAQGLADLQDSGQVAVVGRKTRYSPMAAALMNGQSGHVLDFDDTHMGGVILHASSPILSALISACWGRPWIGRKLLAAYVAGFEVAVRVGQAAPAHHDGGWHLTGTLGTVGAAAACANFLGLTPEQTVYAIGIGATQAAGMQQNRGTSCKSFHAGKAAQSGLLAAYLARHDFSASPEILEGKKGFIRIYSQTQDLDRLVAGLGSNWEILANGFKPYACGVVLHPAIDAMIQASYQLPSTKTWRDVVSVELRVNPAAIKITGVQKPGTGLMTKFSIGHAAAVAFIDRAGGLSQFSEASHQRADVAVMSGKVQVVGDESLARDQASAAVTFGDGNPKVCVQVGHATGTVANPLSDEALEQKYRLNAIDSGLDIRIDQNLARFWGFDSK